MLHAMHNDPVMIGREIDSKNHFLILYSIVLLEGESDHGGAPPSRTN